MGDQALNWDEAKAKATAKAWIDPLFRQILVQNPREAFKAIGYEIPSHLQIRTIEQNQGSRVLVLPSLPKSDEPLTQEQLRNFAVGHNTLFSADDQNYEEFK